ncbi:MAG TPA: ABC transporter substrate-binding protein [Paracoccaceae bacterium]|nr:ABC transporter substrate-binding protein [Paracoccaceae bacterium]
MKKILMTTAAASVMATSAFAAGHEINIGVILGFTGPIESLTPDMAASAEMAFAEASASGLLLGGKVIVPIRGDSTCVDAAAATAAAERLVTSDNVAAIYGPDCSGVTAAVTNNVAVPNGITVISPSATSPALSTIEDNDLFFRTSPSDARQGQVIAEMLGERGISEIAVTYTNSDYGKGLADAFEAAFTAAGGTVTISASHEDGKGDYSAEVGALAASGAEYLAVFGYLDQGGLGIIRNALDSGAFETFVLGDGMYGESILENLGSDLDGSFGAVPASDSDGAATLKAMVEGTVGDPSGPYVGESYDAGALIAFAIQAGGSADRASIAANILNVANAPGEPIQPGEIAKGLQILADGGEIDYVGATNVELIGPGEAAGSYLEYKVEGGKFATIQYR